MTEPRLPSLSLPFTSQPHDRSGSDEANTQGEITLELVSSLATASLKHLLFAKGQVSKPIASLSLDRRRQTASHDSRSKQCQRSGICVDRKRDRLLDRIDSARMLLKGAVMDVARMSERTTADFTMMVCMGQSLALLKECYRVRITFDVPAVSGDDSNELQTRAVKSASVMERKLVRFLVEQSTNELADESEAKTSNEVPSLGKAFQIPLSPMKTFLLILAPPSFNCAGWRPKRHLQLGECKLSGANRTSLDSEEIDRESHLRNGNDFPIPLFPEGSAKQCCIQNAVANRSKCDLPDNFDPVQSWGSSIRSPRFDKGTPSSSFHLCSTISRELHPHPLPSNSGCSLSTAKLEDNDWTSQRESHSEEIAELSEALSPLKRRGRRPEPVSSPYSPCGKISAPHLGATSKYSCDSFLSDRTITRHRDRLQQARPFADANDMTTLAKHYKAASNDHGREVTDADKLDRRRAARTLSKMGTARLKASTASRQPVNRRPVVTNGKSVQPKGKKLLTSGFAIDCRDPNRYAEDGLKAQSEEEREKIWFVCEDSFYGFS